MLSPDWSVLCYPLFHFFWGDGVAEACGYIKLPGILPEDGMCFMCLQTEIPEGEELIGQ